MSKESFIKAVVPLEHLLDESGWTVDREAAANHLLIRRARDQLDLRLGRVDEILDECALEERAPKASEKRECERLQREATDIGEVVAEATEICDDPERSRRRHLEAVGRMSSRAGGSLVGAGMVQRDRSPLSLEIPESVMREVRDGIVDRKTVSRQLSTAALDPSTPATLASRGRLGDYLTVRTASTPSSAFLSTTAVTPAGVVAEGAPKPEIATTALVPATHQKLAGYIDVSREEIVYGGDVGSAVEGIAVRQLVSAENTAIATALAGATAITAGATPAQSLLAGVASVAAGGYVPTVIAISPADLASVIGETSATAGYPVTGNATELTPVLWGTPLVSALGLAAGTGYVWGREAVGASVAQPPTMLVDPYSQARSNLVDVVIEELVAFVLISAVGAAKVDLAGP